MTRLMGKRRTSEGRKLNSEERVGTKVRKKSDINSVLADTEYTLRKEGKQGDAKARFIRA